MGRVYAWVTSCNGQYYYSWINSENGGCSTNQGDIDACAPEFARTATEEEYEQAFNRMLNSLCPDIDRSLFKSYKAYFDIGCDKPDDWQKYKNA